MAKMYTLDEKLLVGVPEIRIGDVIIKVDDRQKTVKKFLKIAEKADDNDVEMMDELLKMALDPKDYKKIDAMDLSWSAHKELTRLVLAAMTGQDIVVNEEESKEDMEERFPKNT